MRTRRVLEAPRRVLTKPTLSEVVMADKLLCKIDGCGKPVKSRGMCTPHYLKWWRNFLAPKDTRPCSIDGCGGPLLARGLCRKHYEASRPQCLVPACEKPLKAHGLCSGHYKRFRKYGDPLGGGPEKGAPLKWIDEVAVIYQSDECLTWPFGGNGNGYGSVFSDGRITCPHRIICERVNGPAPTPRHDAAHSCGKGHEGCVNPRHLRWATRSENLMDRVDHDTHTRGERSPLAKLTEDAVLSIRSRSPDTTVRSLARQFGVSPGAIYHVLKKDSWAWLDDN